MILAAFVLLIMFCTKSILILPCCCNHLSLNMVSQTLFQTMLQELVPSCCISCSSTPLIAILCKLGIFCRWVSTACFLVGYTTPCGRGGLSPKEWSLCGRLLLTWVSITICEVFWSAAVFTKRLSCEELHRGHICWGILRDYIEINHASVDCLATGSLVSLAAALISKQTGAGLLGKEYLLLPPITMLGWPTFAGQSHDLFTVILYDNYIPPATFRVNDFYPPPYDNMVSCSPKGACKHRRDFLHFLHVFFF